MTTSTDPTGSGGPGRAPSGRYDTDRRGRRTVAIVAGASVSVLFLGWLAWATVFHADPEISSQEIGFTIVDDNTATIRVRVEQSPDLTGVSCSLRAISSDKAVVGQTTFVPEPGAGPIYTTEVRTDRRATTVEWIGCRADGQTRYR